MFGSILLTAAAVAAAPDPRYVAFPGGRMGALTSRVLRLELGTAFIDAETVTFASRESAPAPAFTHALSASGLMVKTSRVTLRLALPLDAAGAKGSFTCARMNVTMEAGKVVCPGTGAIATRHAVPSHPGGVTSTWTEIIRGDEAGNLNGSVSTTDCYCGAGCCYDILNSRMQYGLLSKSGWSVVDDSSTALWDDTTEWRWQRPRPAGSTTDLCIRIPAVYSLSI